MPIYDYNCTCGVVFEELRKIEERQTAVCPSCGGEATQKISAPMFKLEGITGAFPTAYDQWEKKRRQKMAQERKFEE